MGLIRLPRPLLLLSLLFLALPGKLRGDPLPAAAAAPLAAEIRDLEETLADPGHTGSARRGSLLRLARLLRLSGNIEAAARAWTDAAFAVPDWRDDAALVEGARCWAALGELEKAGEALQRVLLTGRDPESLRGARFLGAQLEGLRTGDKAALEALTADAAFGGRKAAAYYTLWRVSGDEAYRSRLRAEYPESPEARIAADGGEGPVRAAPQALWFLFPGREALSLEAPAQITGEAPPLPAAAPAPSAPRTGRAFLQTGRFSREENARTQAARLKSAGFAAELTRRRAAGADYWVVTVPPGEDMSRTGFLLRDAGFESFPVFGEE
jgi:DedD protein